MSHTSSFHLGRSEWIWMVFVNIRHMPHCLCANRCKSKLHTWCHLAWHIPRCSWPCPKKCHHRKCRLQLCPPQLVDVCCVCVVVHAIPEIVTLHTSTFLRAFPGLLGGGNFKHAELWINMNRYCQVWPPAVTLGLVHAWFAGWLQ